MKAGAHVALVLASAAARARMAPWYSVRLKVYLQAIHKNRKGSGSPDGSGRNHCMRQKR